MPRILSLFVAAVAVAAHGQSPDIETVFKGEVLKFTFDQSKVFPGTTRDVWVYVPREYDGKTAST
jgi:gluconolactonase